MKVTDLFILCKWENLNNRQCIKYLFAPLYLSKINTKTVLIFGPDGFDEG